MGGCMHALFNAIYATFMLELCRLCTIYAKIMQVM